jgi:hypothetical protein
MADRLRSIMVELRPRSLSDQALPLAALSAITLLNISPSPQPSPRRGEGGTREAGGEGLNKVE